MRLARATLLLALNACAMLSCERGSDLDGRPPCDQLKGALCERTSECAVEQGLTPAADADVFTMRCLRSLELDLRCSDAVTSDRYDPADFALCQANLSEMPCDRVGNALRAGVVVAPAASCAELFDL